MSEIKYKIVTLAKAGVAGGADYQYYPRIHQREKINLRQLAQRISKKSSFTTADVFGILEALIEEIPELVLSNHSVHLNDLGTFSLHIKANASNSPGEVNEQKIKQLKLAFRPSKYIKQSLKQARFTKSD
ncbi:MAG: HU family DNA-binding protein [Candidatus Delongbacteria bacterium]|nr:HU family DNA-binding protein [Candidatus Delongbacteria bacterium]